MLSLPPRVAGSVITETIDHDGNRGNNPSLSQYTVTSADLVPETQHRLASVFRDFLFSTGPVIEDGQLVTAQLSDPPFFVTGLPTSEAYWARAAIGGVVRDVLVQVFERRVLTYVPTNDPAFRVEMGNIGLHYRAWRYGTSLNYFAAIVGNRWTYTNSGSGLDTVYQIVDLDTAFKPGQTLLKVLVASTAGPSASSTEYWQEQDGKLLIHGVRQPGGAVVSTSHPTSPTATAWMSGTNGRPRRRERRGRGAARRRSPTTSPSRTPRQSRPPAAPTRPSKSCGRITTPATGAPRRRRSGSAPTSGW